MPQLIFLLIVTIIVLGLIVLLFRKQKKLSLQEFQRFSTTINKTKSLDPAHSVLESHKIFVKAVSKVYSGETAAKTVAKAQKQFPNKGKIWHFHGLRNRIAHETGVKITHAQAENARKEFVRALKSISKNS